jgi:hypothetical protein
MFVSTKADKMKNSDLLFASHPPVHCVGRVPLPFHKGRLGAINVNLFYRKKKRCHK